MARKSGPKKPSKTPQENAPPEVIPAAWLALWIGLSERRLRQLADEGVLVKRGRAFYEPGPSLQGLLRHVEKKEIDKRLSESSSRSQFEAERARKLKLENDEREGLLISTPLVHGAVDFIVGMLRTDLASVPARGSEDVATRRRVEHAIDDVLNRISERAAKASVCLAEGRDPLEANEEATT